MRSQKFNCHLKSFQKPSSERHRDKLINVLNYILANQVRIIKKIFCILFRGSRAKNQLFKTFQRSGTTLMNSQTVYKKIAKL